MRCPGQKTSYRPCVRHTEEPRDVSGFWLVTDQFHLPLGLNSGCVTAWRPLSKEGKCMPDTRLRPLATPQRPVCSTPKHRPYPLTPVVGTKESVALETCCAGSHMAPTLPVLHSHHQRWPSLAAAGLLTQTAAGQTRSARSWAVGKGTVGDRWPRRPAARPPFLPHPDLACLLHQGPEAGELAGRAALPSPYATDLDENLQVLQVFAVPLVERLQELQALAGGAHVHPLPAAVLGGVLVRVLSRVELLQQGTGRDGTTRSVPTWTGSGPSLLATVAAWGPRVEAAVAAPAHRSGKLVCIRSLQLELLAILACQEVSLWVELEGASDGQGGDNLKWRWPACW